MAGVERETPHQKSLVYHTVFYECPVCYFVDFETKQAVLGHHHTWERRQQVDLCVYCKEEENVVADT